MMSGAQARAHLALLGLSQTDAAELLGTNSRTVRRWVEDDNQEIPGPAEQALRAWRDCTARAGPGVPITNRSPARVASSRTRGAWLHTP
jgi:hypothetical protein